MYTRLSPFLCLSVPLFLDVVLYYGEMQCRNVLCHTFRAQDICIFVCVCVCVCKYMHVKIYAHTFIVHTHTYIYKHMHR